MTENTSQTEGQAPTVRLVCDVGSGQEMTAVSHAEVSTTVTCLYLGDLDRPAARSVGSA